MKKTFVLIFAAVTFSLAVKAQTFHVPENYVLKEKADYAKYEEDVIKGIDWLQDTPWALEEQKRMETNAFLLKWMQGNPAVNIEINSSVAKMTDKNPPLLITFMGGYTKYALQNKTGFNKDKANLAGVKAVIDKYVLETDHKNNSLLNKLVKIDKEGKLSNWIESDFYKTK
ncbi:hypothetical protein LX99_00250 [Mucilaginibacter oryzae]|uniref:Uncharacterized protein n=1 Tax=Mucilaginibacter oryzae TaxID=468058 RepID=A0A316HIF1_9SPHI|nr:hypothetical protein [Mucilaginibacter oryzae]PWK79790.1 hypothetical protein LX99_00250 [Mucilaginibacter oryzae]